MAAGIVAVAPALFFGVIIPYGGPGEAVAIAVIAGLFLVALCTAFVAIRRVRLTDRHPRLSMIRRYRLTVSPGSRP